MDARRTRSCLLWERLSPSTGFMSVWQQLSLFTLLGTCMPSVVYYLWKFAYDALTSCPKQGTLAHSHDRVRCSFRCGEADMQLWLLASSASLSDSVVSIPVHHPAIVTFSTCRFVLCNAHFGVWYKWCHIVLCRGYEITCVCYFRFRASYSTWRHTPRVRLVSHPVFDWFHTMCSIGFTPCVRLVSERHIPRGDTPSIRLVSHPVFDWFHTLCSIGFTPCVRLVSHPVFDWFQSVIFHVETHPVFDWFSQCVTFNFFPTRRHELAYNIFNVIAVYLAPLVVIIISYSLILWEITKKTREGRGMSLAMLLYVVEVYR